MARRRPATRAGLCAILMALASNADPALAGESSPQATRRHYEIAAMPIGTALSRFSEISRVDLLLREPVKREGSTQPVRGELTPSEALTLLLRGTGLVARFTSARSAVIIPVGSEAIPADRPLMEKRPGRPLLNLDTMQVSARRTIGGTFDPRTDLAFAQQLGARIRRIILDQGIFPGGRSMDLRLITGLSPEGTLQGVRIVRGCNDAALNARVLKALEGAHSGVALPPGLRQPLTFDLAGR